MCRGVRRVIDGDEDPVVSGKRGERGELGRVGHGVDHEQVIHPGRGQDGRLPYGGHGQAARARLELAAREVGALVRLVVRADRGLASSLSSFAMWSMLRCAASMSSTRAGVTSSSRRLPMAPPYWCLTRS